MKPTKVMKRAGKDLLEALQERLHVHEVDPPPRRFWIRTGREIMAQPLRAQRSGGTPVANMRGPATIDTAYNT